MPGHEPGKAARARDLCRSLKPIIGNQAERIWLAYVAENEGGKTQILDYLELLAAQHFHGQLDDQGPGLIPLKADDAVGEYELGTVTYNGKELYSFGLREDEFIQHVGVFGRSGAGKTNLGFLLVQQLLAKGKPILIFDWKRNYRDLMALPGFEDVAVYTAGRSVSPLSFNPLIPPAGTLPKTWLKKIISVICHAYLLGDGVAYLLQEALDRVYDDAGVYSGSIERWPTFRDVFNVLKKRDASGREAGWMSSALRALSSLCFGEMDVLLNQGDNHFEQLLTKPVILELDALTQSDKVMLVQSMLLWIHHYRMTKPAREQLRHLIVIEEAHHVLSDIRSPLLGGQTTIDTVFREIREFGEGIIYLDQHPSQISIPALGNTYATFCFNVKHRADVNAMAQAMLLDEEKKLLGTISLGQAVVRLQGRGDGSFTIAVPEFNIKKGSVTDADVTYRMARLGLLSARRQTKDVASVVTPPASNSASATMHARTETSASDAGPFATDGRAFRAVDDLMVALLRDVEHHPDSGVAERYKRLGISVRQGQKLKDALIGQGLVQEELQTTRTGRCRVIRLSEQGRLLLSDASNSPEEPL